MSEPAVRIDLPAGSGPHPVLVLAPGQRYHMALPVLAQVAQQCVRRGLAVVRFDWSQPSAPSAPEPAAEAQDLRAVLERVRADPRFDGRQVWVGGKSLGSVLAWRLLRADASLRGAVLLTPLCSHGELYAGMAGEQRPLFFLAGEQDPQCAPAALYRLALEAKGPTRVAIVSGGHDLVDARWAVAQWDEALARNVDTAGRLVADFLAAHGAAETPGSLREPGLREGA